MAEGKQLSSRAAPGNMAGCGGKIHPFWAGVRRPLGTWSQVLQTQEREEPKLQKEFGGKIISGKALAFFFQGSRKYTEKCEFLLGEYLLSIMDLCASINTGKYSAVCCMFPHLTHVEYGKYTLFYFGRRVYR